MSLPSWAVITPLRNLFAVHSTRQLKEIYVFALLFSFAFSLITLFEPIFFYQQGFSIPEIALYYALHYCLYVVVLPWGGQFAARFGLERSLSLSTPLFVLYFLCLAAIPERPAIFWVALVVLTAHKMFYWPAYHASFAKFADGKNRGTELSWMGVITYGTGILGPLAGGVIATMFGFQALFLLAAATVLFAAAPLLLTKERFRPVTLEYSAPWQLMRTRRARRMVISMIGMGEELIHLVIWPVFLFLVLGNVEQLGFIAALSVALMTLGGFLIGEASDRFSERRVLRWSIPLVVVSNWLRTFVATPVWALFTDALVRITSVGVRTPLLSRLYKEAQSSHVLTYCLTFEIVLAIAKAATAFTLVGLFLVLPAAEAFAVTFWLAAVFSVFYGFI